MISDIVAEDQAEVAVPKGKFMPVPLTTLHPSMPLPVDLYLKSAGDASPVLYRQREYPISPEDFERLVEHGTRVAYILEEQVTGYQAYLRDNLRTILEDEQCCGDPARRIGDELMFVEAAKSNHEELSRIKFGKMLTSCPHCFNSFRFGYHQYSYELDVEHYSTVIDELLREAKLNLKIEGKPTVTYHDPCFLGRWNEIYDAPRRIIESIEGVTLTEMSRSHEKSFCCGGGGGHMFFEIEEGERISKLRMDECLETDAETLVVACPYCNTMLKSEASEKINVIDIAELLEAAMDKADT